LNNFGQEKNPTRSEIPAVGMDRFISGAQTLSQTKFICWQFDAKVGEQKID
jgi:hypothetical protein